MKDANKKSNRKRGSNAVGQLHHSVYPPQQNRNTEGRVRKKHQKISEEIGSQGRTIDGTNMMRDMSKKGLTIDKVILNLLGDRSSSYTIG